ncbi:hypothetical protein [Actinomadura sp. HBU206391]|uniref:hypothetical protein n=1 Tax=Actinomadura sp. HBU206391 TaxID=2731692 RepID=UPI0016501055|nr:hypothetical protein [Actinomadura sp. HBU206391]MBC6458416.1 hypothetical protein [Actinomadura sp. HBU206391]
MQLTNEFRADVARAMGMKPREIVDAEEADGGLVVTTHDGVKTLLTEDGEVKPYAPSPVEVAKEKLAEIVDQPPATPGPDVVPDASAKDVLAWVGDDKERAAQALAAEEGREKPRSGLVGDLQKLVS